MGLRARKVLGTAALWCALQAACGTQPVDLIPVLQKPDGSEPEIVGDSVPAAALERLRAAPNDMGMEGLQLVYPSPPALVLPADLAPIVFEWQASGPKPPAPMPAPAPPADPMKPDPMKDKAKAEADPLLAYELRARSDRADVRVYVAAQRAGFPRGTWTDLLREHTGTTLRIELRGVRQSGAFAHAKPLELRVRSALQGAFYSFSTTAKGVMRGELSRTHERLSLPSPDVRGAPSTGCVGCHALSHDGKRGLAAVGGSESLFSWLFANGGASGPTLEATEPSGDYSFGAFDLTAARIARVQAGRLSIFNADSGALLQQTPAPLLAASTAPDWSPDSRFIALVIQTDKGSSLATVAVALDGSLSEPQVLVSSGKEESFSWPVYSPDGAFIAYERRKGPMREVKDARLFLVRASGGDPIELNALREKPMSGASAPSFVPGDTPEHTYLVFSSQRSVGSAMLAEGQQQLFASALDLSLAAAGKDPSSQPFWLPFQQRTSSYLRAQWAPALRTCTASDEVCDETDDDCDGQVDEECRTPTAETCDNQLDEDLDGAADEGCGCSYTELCGNQKDDDCDLHTDEQPCMPASGK